MFSCPSQLYFIDLTNLSVIKVIVFILNKKFFRMHMFLFRMADRFHDQFSKPFKTYDRNESKMTTCCQATRRKVTPNTSFR